MRVLWFFYESIAMMLLDRRLDTGFSMVLGAKPELECVMQDNCLMVKV